MKKTVLRILGLALILTLLAGIVPASAEGGSGFGGNLKWELKNGVLTISGTGAMNDFNSNSIAPPWRQYRNEITSAVIEPGCTYIGSFAFEY
jgi:hypothetical protein